MKTIVVTKKIKAPLSRVFQSVADIRNFSEILPHITEYEILSETQSGLGTKFIETRTMKNNVHKTELEVTEYVEDELARMVADSHGTIWDTTFRTAEAEGVTTLTLSMDAFAYRWPTRIVNVLFRKMIAKAVDADMQMVKKHLEKD